MSLFTTFDLASSGLNVQRQRLDVAAENMANISSTKTPEGGPYQKKVLEIGAKAMGLKDSFNTYLKGAQMQGAEILGIQKSKEAPLEIYDPSHPDAKENGYVSMPNISSMEEMVNLMGATSAYEANMSVFSEAKTLFLRTLDMGA